MLEGSAMTALEAVMILLGAAVAVPTILYVLVPMGPQAVPVAARRADADLTPLPAHAK
jgi:hypothetical protein